jgi:putative membrane-bound dehydrogenase-like protein
MLKKFFVVVAGVLLSVSLASAEVARLEVLFLGDRRGHEPLERYRELKQALAVKGFNLTYSENLGELTRDRLDRYEALVVFSSHEGDKVPEALIPWVKAGGGLVAIHNAGTSFRESKEWSALLGAAFEKNDGGEFQAATSDPNHPVTRGLAKLDARENSYAPVDPSADITVLQTASNAAGQQPWTWTRAEGKGRVFFTASGHAKDVWAKPEFHDLIRRGILWSVGDKRAAEFATLKLPELVIEEPKIEGRTHPDIPMMALQKPLSPAASAAHTQVPAGTKLELFASEPMVVNPIAIDWDTRGRCWVVESFGYPNDVPKDPGTGADNIKILEDTNGDGKADKVTVFASKLRHCTTLVFVKGGVVATDGPDIVFLRDDNNDGVSDTRTVLATGLRIWDTHASTSHFTYGLDNWIYATVGYSGVKMTLNGKDMEFGASVFRFRPDVSKLEFLQRTTNNTWGLGLTEEGDVIGSTANNNPSWLLTVPAAAYEGSGLEQPYTPRLDDAPLYFPNTKDITQVDQLDRFTAAAGHQFYTDNLLKDIFTPEQAFICEPTGHLAAIGTLRPKGSIMSTDLRGNNVFASVDAWAAPVAARTGPDGNVWIADWYNPIIQHNVVFRFWNPARGYDYPHSPYHIGEKKPGKGNAYITPLRDREHGRIWRIVPKTGTARKAPALDPAKPATLLAALASPSQHTRSHAQRLLVERANQDVVPALEKLITSNAKPLGSSKPLAAVHAIWTLEGLGAGPGTPGHAILAKALASQDPLVRRHALQALGGNDPAVVSALPTLIKEVADPRERLIVLTTAAQSAPNDLTAAALWELVTTAKDFDEPLTATARVAMRRQGTTLLAVAFAKPGALAADAWQNKELVALAGRIAAGPNRPAVAALLASAPAGLKPELERVLKESATAAPTEVPLPEHLTEGRNLYMKVCIECHQADGNGVAGTFPPLAGSEWTSGDLPTLQRIMLGGLYGPIEVKGVKFNSAMPGHSHSTDAELAAVASYVRYAFGGKKDEKPVTPEAFKALRPEIEKRKFTPWTVEELEKLKGK